MGYNYTFDPTPRELMAYADASVVNLTAYEMPCVIPFAVPSMEPGLFMNVTMSVMSNQLIEILCSAAVRQMGGPPNWPGSQGTYDASVARLMALYANWTHQGVGGGEYYIVGPNDVFNLLVADEWTQGQVNAQLTANGYGGATGYNGIPLVGKDIGFFAVPDKSYPHLKLPEGKDVVTSDQLPPVGGIESVIAGAGDDDKTNWGLVAAGGAAAVAAGFVVFKMVKKGR